MPLETIAKKAVDAKSSTMKELHEAKKSAAGKYKQYLDKKSTNPDCFRIGDYIGLPLARASETDEKTFQDGKDTIIKDRDDRYYVVIGKADA